MLRGGGRPEPGFTEFLRRLEGSSGSPAIARMLAELGEESEEGGGDCNCVFCELRRSIEDKIPTKAKPAEVDLTKPRIEDGILILPHPQARDILPMVEGRQNVERIRAEAAKIQNDIQAFNMLIAGVKGITSTVSAGAAETVTKLADAVIRNILNDIEPVSTDEEKAVKRELAVLLNGEEKVDWLAVKHSSIGKATMPVVVQSAVRTAFDTISRTIEEARLALTLATAAEQALELQLLRLRSKFPPELSSLGELPVDRMAVADLRLAVKHWEDRGEQAERFAAALKEAADAKIEAQRLQQQLQEASAAVERLQQQLQEANDVVVQRNAEIRHLFHSNRTMRGMLKKKGKKKPATAKK
jgi:hypothetical protein